MKVPIGPCSWRISDACTTFERRRSRGVFVVITEPREQGEELGLGARSNEGCVRASETRPIVCVYKNYEPLYLALRNQRAKNVLYSQWVPRTSSTAEHVRDWVMYG